MQLFSSYVTLSIHTLHVCTIPSIRPTIRALPNFLSIHLLVLSLISLGLGLPVGVVGWKQTFHLLLSIHSSIDPPCHPSICLSSNLPILLAIDLSMLSIHLSISCDLFIHAWILIVWFEAVVYSWRFSELNTSSIVRRNFACLGVSKMILHHTDDQSEAFQASEKKSWTAVQHWTWLIGIMTCPIQVLATCLSHQIDCVTIKVLSTGLGKVHIAC